MKSTSSPNTRGKVGLAMVFFLVLPMVWAACTKDAASEVAPATPVATDTAGASKAMAVPAKAMPGDGADEAVPTGQSVGGDDSYKVLLDAPESIAAGSEGIVRVSVVPAKGWKMNHEFPTKLAVTAPDGVSVTQAEQRKNDAERFDDGGAVFAVKFKADAAGAKSFAAKFKFAVCTDATCDPKKEELAWVVNIK